MKLLLAALFDASKLFISFVASVIVMFAIIAYMPFKPLPIIALAIASFVILVLTRWSDMKRRQDETDRDNH